MISSSDKLSEDARYEPQADPSAMDTQVGIYDPYSDKDTMNIR